MGGSNLCVQTGCGRWRSGRVTSGGFAPTGVVATTPRRPGRTGEGSLDDEGVTRGRAVDRVGRPLRRRGGRGEEGDGAREGRAGGGPGRRGEGDPGGGRVVRPGLRRG